MPFGLLFRLMLAEIGLLILALAQPLTGEGRNEQGNAIAKGETPALWAKFVSPAETEKTVTAEASAIGRKIKKTAHGLVTKNLVVITELNGKTVLGEEAGGLVVGVSYWVHEVSSSEFALATTKTKAESATEGEWIEFTVEVKATTKLAKVVEHTGAKTKRKATAFAACSEGISEDSTAHEIEASGAVTVVWAMYWSAETVGTLIALEATTSKTLAEGDIWKLTNAKINQNAFVV